MKYLKIHARPNANGNSEQDFQQAYVELSNAKASLMTATRLLMTDVLHGRNYPHFDRSEDQSVNDRTEAWKIAHEADAKIGELMSAVVNALENL